MIAPNPYHHRCGNMMGKYTHETCKLCPHILVAHTVEGTCTICEAANVPVPVVTEVLSPIDATMGNVYVVLPDRVQCARHLDLASGTATMIDGRIAITYRLVDIAETNTDA